MWLLQTNSLDLKEFIGRDDRPRYAILSHRWQGEELSFRDLKPKHREQLASRPGYAKVRAFCDRARAEGYQWAWVDTCCIDRKSSAELSEAINSMYQWYSDAGVCFAYLVDLPGEDSADSEERQEAFRCSEWFKRGWTLQELLAPRHVQFYDSDWEFYGTKAGLADEISAVTGIRRGYLSEAGFHQEEDDDEYSTHHFMTASIARKMSWLSNRTTTRPEDMAYCMLGLFDVNMPLLYGEGNKAFTRLQLELIEDIDDESIYAWHAPVSDSPILAPWPAAFSSSERIIHPPSEATELTRPASQITNKGLYIEAVLVPSLNAGGRRPLSLLPLNCCVSGMKKLHMAVAIRAGSGDTFHREEGLDFYTIDYGEPEADVAIVQKGTGIRFGRQDEHDPWADLADVTADYENAVSAGPWRPDTRKRQAFYLSLNYRGLG